MSEKRCKELYDLRAEADQALRKISKFLEKPEYADQAMENLFNIAIWTSSTLNHFRFKEPDTLKRFASKQSQWPYWLGHDQKGWVKSRMPREIRDVLYEIGLNTDGANGPSGAKNDFLGRIIKSERAALVEFRRDPNATPSYADDLEASEELRNKILGLPKLENSRKSLRAWAAVIFDRIFQWHTLLEERGAGTYKRSLELFLEEGGEIVERNRRESSFYDKSKFAYSFFRPCSDTLLQRQRIKAILDKKKLIEKAHPTDDEFREQSIKVIIGRLKVKPFSTQFE
jgi:hypothetical protein